MGSDRRVEIKPQSDEFADAAKDAARQICESFIDSGGDPSATLAGLIGSVGSALAGKFVGDRVESAAVERLTRFGRSVGSLSSQVGAGARGAAIGGRFGRSLGYFGVAAGAALGWAYGEEINSAMNSLKEQTCGQISQ